MKEIIFILEEDIEGGYTARALEFPIFTQGETLEEVKRNIKDALRCHFDEEDKIPNIKPNFERYCELSKNERRRFYKETFF